MHCNEKYYLCFLGSLQYAPGPHGDIPAKRSKGICQGGRVEELKGLGSLVELCDRVVLFRHQTLDDNIKVRNLSQQKSHVGQVIGACDEAEDVFNVSWI